MRQFLLKANWTPDERYPKLQYKDASGTLMMLPSDLVLIQVGGGERRGRASGDKDASGTLPLPCWSCS